MLGPQGTDSPQLIFVKVVEVWRRKTALGLWVRWDILVLKPENLCGMPHAPQGFEIFEISLFLDGLWSAILFKMKNKSEIDLNLNATLV